MKKPSTLWSSLVLIAVLIVTSGARPALAQEPERPPALEAGRGAPGQAAPPAPGVEAQGTGGPDDYGYTWDDSVAFHWLDASLGTDSGLSGLDKFTGPVDIGFPFQFYENTYSQLYFSTKGMVTFGSGTYNWNNTRLPMESPPNNLIAAYWSDMAVGGSYNTGKVYYLRGGTAPNRYFVIEWYNATSCCTYGSTEYKTFEVILYENGDIVTQWLSLAGYRYGATVGIEDSIGASGLLYLYNSSSALNGKAVRFRRPGLSARVQVYPPYQGQFSRAGGVARFQIPIRNTGDLGSDVYDLTSASAWPIALYQPDGVTPLSDTDGDGLVDTGPLAQMGNTVVIADMQVPGGASVGAAVAATVTARSSLNTGKSKSVTLQAAIPAPFVQAYRDDYDDVMSLYLVQPGAQEVKSAGDYGYDLAVTEAPNGDFVYAWDAGRCADYNCNIYVNEIEYTILNRFGETVRVVSKLTNHSTATNSTYDYQPVVAVAADGRIGLLWYRYLYRYADNRSQYNYNLFFAILDASGNVVYGPANLTNNTAWGYPWNDPDVPGFYYPRIAATADNRFVLGWYREERVSGCSSGDCTLYDVYYAVRDSYGNPVRGITRFTNDTTGSSWEGYYYPSLTALAGSRALLTWSRNSDGDIYYAVLDSAGNVVRDKTNLSSGSGSYGYYADAAQLADGRIVVAWTANNTIRFAVLDTAYNRTVGPLDLSNPAAPWGDGYVSVAADPAGHAILTWMDYDYYARLRLYYALVDGTGAILTPPMIFRRSRDSSARIQTSYYGHGNASYSSPIASGVDGSMQSGVITAFAGPGGIAPFTLAYANHGQTIATGTLMTATLGTGLTYLGDTSGLPAAVTGSIITWTLPPLSFLENRKFALHVRLPDTASIGDQYSLTMALATVEEDANPADNQIGVLATAGVQVYLPVVYRR